MQRAIKALFFTHWEEHPYITQLVSSLSKIDVKVDYSSSLWELLSLGLRRREYDVIHLHWLEPFFISSNIFTSTLGLLRLLLALTLIRLKGSKIVWTVHNLTNHEQKYSRLDQVCSYSVFRLSEQVIAHCSKAKAAVEYRFSYSSEHSKVTVIPHGNFSSYYENKVTSEESKKIVGTISSRLTFLFIGVIRPYKGLDRLVEVFQEMSEYNQDALPTLVIAGRIPGEEPLSEKLLRTIESNDLIIFKPGFVPDEEIQLYMNASDVVVFPYERILTSGSVLMAMSFAKACIAPNIGCISEVLPDSPLVYDQSVEGGLYGAMQYSLENASNLREIGRQNKQIADSLGWDKIASMTCHLYH